MSDVQKELLTDLGGEKQRRVKKGRQGGILWLQKGGRAELGSNVTQPSKVAWASLVAALSMPSCTGIQA